MPFGEGEITLRNFPATLVDSVKEEKTLCISQDLCLMQRPWNTEAISEPWKQKLMFDVLTLKAKLFLPHSNVRFEK